MQPALETKTVLPQRRQEREQVEQQHAAGKRVVVDDLASVRVSGEHVDGDAGARGGADEEGEG